MGSVSKIEAFLHLAGEQPGLQEAAVQLLNFYRTRYPQVLAERCSDDSFVLGPDREQVTKEQRAGLALGELELLLERASGRGREGWQTAQELVQKFIGMFPEFQGKEPSMQDTQNPSRLCANDGSWKVVVYPLGGPYYHIAVTPPAEA